MLSAPAGYRGARANDGAVIDRVGLAALPPAKRADVIYAEAQAAMSRRLWQAALGDTGSGGDREVSPLSSIEGRAPGGSSIESLLASLIGELRTAREERPTAPVQTGGAPVPMAAATASSAAVMAPAPTTSSAAVDAVDGLGPNIRFRSTLAAAAERVGVPASALAAIVDAEAGKAADGSWKVYSRNPRSSAAGLGQFLNRTWEGLAESRGTWLHDYADRQGWLGADGQVRADCRVAVLACRYDPTAAINGIADYARRNLDGLRHAGISSEGEVRATARLAYLGHHLGLGDAVHFLRGNGLSAPRARALLDAQVGMSSSARRIAETGDATSAHREWLVSYLDRKIRPDRFARQVNG